MRQQYIFSEEATIHDVVHSREDQTKKALTAISSGDLENSSIEDLVADLFERFRLEVPVLDRAGTKELEISEVDIDVSGAPNRAFFEPGPHYVTGSLVRISVPFNGNAQLFRYPSSNFGSPIPAEIVEGAVVLSYSTEHPNGPEIQRDFDNRLSLIETALQFIRGAAEEWNRRLTDLLRTELGKRKEKQKRDQGFTLGYPKALPIADTTVRESQALPPTHYDLFLSHASEDKDSIARPLYSALISSGITVWFDEAVLKMGDSLRRKIDEGLARCGHGIVIVSPSFLAKEWPQRELDGLVAREVASGKKAILPIWHQIDQSAIMRYSPPLADRLAAKSEIGVDALVKQILAAIR